MYLKDLVISDSDKTGIEPSLFDHSQMSGQLFQECISSCGVLAWMWFGVQYGQVFLTSSVLPPCVVPVVECGLKHMPACQWVYQCGACKSTQTDIPSLHAMWQVHGGS
jgi:hypothetical protein